LGSVLKLDNTKRLSGNRFGSSYDKEEGPELKGHKRVQGWRKSTKSGKRIPQI